MKQSKIAKLAGEYAAYVDMGMLFAMASLDDGVAYPINSCKEYILDAVYYNYHTLKSWTIYGKIDLHQTKLVACANNLDDKINDILDFINQFELEMKLEQTTLEKISNNQYVFVGSKLWMISSPMLSLYGLLIRNAYDLPHKKGTYFMDSLVGMKKRYESFSDNLLSVIRMILKYGPLEIFGENYSENWDLSAIHGQGIQSFTLNMIQAQHVLVLSKPHWFKYSFEKNDT